VKNYHQYHYIKHSLATSHLPDIVVAAKNTLVEVEVVKQNSTSVE